MHSIRSLAQLRRFVLVAFGAIAFGGAGASAATTVGFDGLAASWPESATPQDDTYLHAGFFWQGFNYDAGYGVGSSDEIILKNSTQISSIAKESGLFNAISIAAFTWTGDRTITFVGYRDGVEVARADCFLPLVASASIPNPGTAFLFPAEFSGLDRLEIDPATIASSSAGFDNFVYSTVAFDATSTVTAGAGVAEPVALATTADTVGEAVNVFDFKITDAGTADGLSTVITTVRLSTSGTGDFSKVNWRLNGPDASDVAGTYDSGANTITFSPLTLSVANGGNETYTVSAYFSSTTGLTNGHTYILSVDGDSPTSLTVGAAGSQMAAGQVAVTNGTGTTVVDAIAPRVVSIVRHNPASSPTDADTLIFRVTFSEVMKQVTVSTGDFSVSGTTAMVTGVTSGDFIVCDVIVSGGNLATLDGTVALGISGTHNLTDEAGNPLTNPTPTGTNENTYVVFNNDAPTIGSLNGDSVNYIEGASAVPLDAGSDATVTDPDNLPDFNGGNATVAIVANRVSTEDVLGIANQGTGAGQIGVSGANVTYGGVTIGTFSGGTGTNDLVITFNSASATPTAVQALVRNLTYRNSNAAVPSTAARTVRVTVNDGDGGTSNNADVTVSVTGIPATVTSVSSSSANALYRPGDTIAVTVTFTETVTVTGNPTLALNSGGTATYASGSGGSTLTFNYTVQSGEAAADLDYSATNSLSLSGGTIRDAASSAATLTLPTVGGGSSLGGQKNLVIDGVAPTVTDARISISGASGAGGAFKIGDTVTASWNNTIVGDNNSDIADVTVDCAAFGGGAAVVATNSSGTWTATYPIVAGAIQATNRNVSVTATDNAGNSTTTTDTTNATVDNIAPTTTIASLALSNDTGTSSTDFITNTAAQTISATLSGAPALGDIVYGSLDNGSTWTDITSKVSGTTLTWDGVTLAGSSTLRLKITDAAGNDGTMASQAYALDTTSPAMTFGALAFSADTGTSSTDFITRTVAQTITAALSGAPVGTDMVYGSLDNGSTWTNITGKVSGTMLAWNGVTLAASSTLQLKVTDAAGNDGTVASQAYTLDTTAPTITFGALAFSADTGTSSTDFITNTASQTIGANLSGAAVGTDILYGSLDNGSTWTDITAKVSGTTLTWDGVTLTGSSTLQLKITDAAGNDGTVASQAYTLDPTASTVTSVSVPANATYVAGQNLDFTVNWSENVTVDTTGGTPTIALTIGSTGRSATYLSGGGTSALVFRYQTQSGDLDADGITVGALALNSSTIWDAAGNNATLTLNSVGSTAAVLVDAEAPTVSSATVPADATYKTGQNLDFTVTYSENVTVAGTPYIGVTLATGGTVQAAHVSGTGTTTLTFRYPVVAGNLDADGVAVASSITLNGGTIKDATGNDAQTTALGFADTAGVLVDGVAPTVSSIDRQTPASASTNATSAVFRVTFSEAITGVDTADFALTSTGTAAGSVASVSAVSGAVYDVTVNTITGNGTLRLDLNAAGTGIADAATNAIATGFTAGQTYTIDNTAPTLTSILRQSPATVNVSAATATWRVTFAGGVSGVDTADFTLTVVAGTPTGTIASVTGVAGSETTVYDVVVNSLAGQGRLRLDLKASGTGIADLAGNALPDGGFTTGDFYLVGITNVFDTVSLTAGTTRLVKGSTSEKVAQRFTTGAAAPLTLTTVTVRLGATTGTPVPVVKVYADNASPVGGTLVTTLTNPGSLTANELNVWTSTQLLTASTTYWLVFEDASAAGSFAIAESAATAGGTGAWLTTDPYAYAFGIDFATNPQTGALQIAIGATSTPTITSALTANGTYGAAFAGYTITATNGPTSFAATGLPAGLNLAAGTGLISGTPTQSGSFNVALTATNASGTGVPSTLVLTIAKAPLTVTANNASRTIGEPNPVLSVSYAGFRGGDSAASLIAVPVATTDANTGSPGGDYAITPSGGVASNYTFTYVAGTLTVTKASQHITFAAIDDMILGQTAALSASASSGAPVSFAVIGGPATLSGNNLSTTGIGLVTVRATQSGNGSYSAAAAVERSFLVTVGLPPTVSTPTQVPVPPSGGTADLAVVDSNPGLSYQWQRNGTDLDGATGPTLTLRNVEPPSAGLYTYTATIPGGAGGTSDPVIVGVSTTERVTGTGELAGADIEHPNGNIYDQLLLAGEGATLTAQTGKITRISFRDLSDDIVQVEFSGAGSLSLVMDGASLPAIAPNYNQPEVEYVKGHVGIVITGADETSNVCVFSVGRYTALNQSLFREEVDYDAVADIAFVAIQSADGRFGGVRTGNVNYFASQGFTGVYAPGVEFAGPVNIGEIQAFDDATPLLVLGSASGVRITGGSMLQPNGAPVKVKGITRLQFTEGTDSHGNAIPAQANQAVLEQDGVNVTDLIVDD